ncbi:hypothetical protein Tco_0714380 [Tanacetum coccineum]
MLRSFSAAILGYCNYLCGRRAIGEQSTCPTDDELSMGTISAIFQKALMSCATTSVRHSQPQGLRATHRTTPAQTELRTRASTARVGPLSGKDPLVIVVADTYHLPAYECGSVLSAVAFLRHPDTQPGLSSWASVAARCFVVSGNALLLAYDIKSVLTQKGLDTFCRKFHIPESVHPQLPSRCMKDSLGRLVVIPDSLTKVSHFEILCRVYSIEPTVGLFRCFYINSKNKGWMSFSKRSDSSVVCYTKPIDSLKHWNDHFFWVDAFACPVSFPWHTGKKVSRYPLPKSTEFNVDDYAVLIAHPAPFWKFLESFLCLVEMSRYYTLDEDTYPGFLHDNDEGRCLSLYIVHLIVFDLVFDYLFAYAEMDLCAFIHVVDPTKVKIVERERAEGETKLLDSTVGRVVPLLPVGPARFEDDLEASMDKLFDEGGSTDQGDSAAGGGHNVVIEPVTDVEDIAAENVTAENPKRQRKKRPAVADSSGSSHPPKQLRGDHGTFSGVSTGGKSPSVIKELLASSILNAEVGVEAVATLPLITSSVSATPEHEGGDPTDSVTGSNLRTIGPSERFIISLDSSHCSSTNATKVEVDSYIRSTASLPVMTEAVITTNIDSAPSLLVPEAKLQLRLLLRPKILFFMIPVLQINSETLHEVFVPQWNVPNDTLLDDHDVSWEFINHLAPLVLFSQIPKMDYHYLFMEFNVGTARQASLNAEVRMRTEYYLSKRKRLESECENQDELMKGKDAEIETLKAQLLLRKQKLQRSLASVFKYLLLKLHRSLRNQVSGYEQLKEQIKEFQYAQMNIVHDKVAKLDVDPVGMALYLKEKFYPHLLTTISGQRPEACYVVAYNPDAEADYNSALQWLREVDFPLLAELSSHNYANPDVKQLMTPIHRYEDQVVLGETSLLFALSVAHFRVEKWNVPNDTLLDDHDVSREFVDHLAPPVLFAQIREMDYDHLFTEFNVGTARQACMNAKVRMQTEYCLSERRRLESECERQADLLKARDGEIKSLKAQLLLKEAEAVEAARLRIQVSVVEATEKLQSSVSAKDLEIKDFNVTVSSRKSQNDGLVDQVHALETTCFSLHDQVSSDGFLPGGEVLSASAYHYIWPEVASERGLKLAVVKCLNSPKYLAALGAAISRAIEKGMQSGLSAGIDHGKEGRSLADVVAYNPAAEADYNSALQRLHEVDFPFLVELRSHKDSSVEDIMNLLRLEDQVVLGETSLSFALSIAHSRVEMIRENIAAQRSALVDVWVPLVEPLSAENLMGAAGTFDSVPATVATTTALSTTFVSTSSVPPITIDDYEIVGADGQEDVQGNVQGNVASFPTVEYEK